MPQTHFATELLAADQRYVWHPYAGVEAGYPMVPVVAAAGVELELADGRRLLDGMSSWWSAIHGYQHPVLDRAIQAQLGKMSHVMFGGLTHPSAVGLCQRLVEITPAGLERVFLCDGGSVAVEVGIKMALQYWQSRGQTQKTRLLSLAGGYHGDTFMAMSVCDPVNGMHHLFADSLRQQLFAPRPAARFGEAVTAAETDALEQLLAQNHSELAAVILEPIVQGAGGMWFYSADYLAEVRALCDRFDVLLIADEIATGFGRTGKLFACEHANISPDILCLGKALTGGYLSLAATLCSERVATGICEGEAGVLMHGPTFMGNPLACAVANASIDLLLSQNWPAAVKRLESGLRAGLSAAAELSTVAEVRVLGAIGVIEMREPVDMAVLQPALVDAGIWLRPFGKLVYTMPPYIMTDQQLGQLCERTVKVLSI
jgi:adenosylmethionine-8-amino-7-oxononanoate aminotransferase